MYVCGISGKNQSQQRWYTVHLLQNTIVKKWSVWLKYLQAIPLFPSGNLKHHWSDVSSWEANATVLPFSVLTC